MKHENNNSKDFLRDLVYKRVAVYFKDSTDVIGALIWDDENTIGVRFNLPDGIKEILYYKSFIKSIEESKPKYSNYHKNDK